MLQKLQNRAARIVTNSSYDAPAANLIKELKWPTIDQTRDGYYCFQINKWSRAHFPLYSIHEKLDTGDYKVEKL